MVCSAAAQQQMEKEWEKWTHHFQPGAQQSSLAWLMSIKTVMCMKLHFQGLMSLFLPDSQYVYLNWTKLIIAKHDGTSLLVPICMQLKKLNYWRERVFLPNTKGWNESWHELIWAHKLLVNVSIRTIKKQQLECEPTRPPESMEFNEVAHPSAYSKKVFYFHINGSIGCAQECHLTSCLCTLMMIWTIRSILENIIYRHISMRHAAIQNELGHSRYDVVTPHWIG